MGWRILVNFILQPMLTLKTHSGFHDLFLKYKIYKIEGTSPLFLKFVKARRVHCVVLHFNEIITNVGYSTYYFVAFQV